MAQPPPLQRKSSLSSKKDDLAIKAEKDSQAMPPPPVPAAAGAASRMGILEPEMRALGDCLRNATVKTAQILNFYADARKLGIQKHASAPPQRLQAALGREIEKYDQLCDSIEAHLLRAIAVLQRDADREQQRIKEAEAAAAAAKQAAGAEAKASGQAEQTGASDGSSQTTVSLGRRPSAISISSLHRPAFPLKLDLSASSLRMSAEEASLFSANLPSPVTLAPKSARPTENYDLMAAFVSSSSDSNTIDLTLPDHTPSDGMNIDLGSSADKPIELDMDSMDIAMSDLFGDETSASSDAKNVVDELFSPIGGPGESSQVKDGDFLSALGVDGSTNNDLFASLDNRDSNSRPGGLNVPSSDTANTPSPGTLLASFSSHQTDGASSSNNVSGSSFDLSNLEDIGFFAGGQDTDMNLDPGLWGMGGGSMDVRGGSTSAEGAKPSS